MKIAAIILARGGSKGVPLKNLQEVGGVSLVGRSVRAARAAPSVERVYVSTDDDAIAAEARAMGGETIERPADISSDGASSESGWLHAYEVIRAAYGDLDALVFLQCTSPFTTGSDIEGCITAMRAQGAACALSVRVDHSFLWTVDDAGFAVGVNHVETGQRMRRQDLPPSYCETGAVYVANAAAFAASGNRFCGPVALYVTDHPPVEIDTPNDLALCRRIASATGAGAPPASRLAAMRAVVMDFDGVHTDDLVHTDQDGRESVRTSRRDGLGLGALRAAGGHEMMILSKERNPVVARRAEKLKIEVAHAVDDKVAALDAWLAEKGVSWDETIFVGNDVNDLPALRRAGVSACPSDAYPDVLAEVDWVLPHPGGKGALRSLCDAIMASKA
ncbi:MAG: acylneuraminate cytidylyltransferase [Pseudomonadota bacterium]